MTEPAVDISVVIPTYNDVSSLESLVSEFRSIENLRVQVVVVDDCSSDGTVELAEELESKGEITLKRHRRNRGAGVARNTGFKAVTGRYTIFFDADDLVHVGALRRGVDLLDETGADLAFFPYLYLRSGDSSHDEMNRLDREIWDAIFSSTESSYRVGGLDDFNRLLQFANYPWNKIVRTETMQEAGLRFGKTKVHNDVLGHWMSLLSSKKIVVVDDSICTHIVESCGKNLSNRRNADRLQLFDALDELYDYLEQVPSLRLRYSHHYWAFALDLISWAESRIDRAFMVDFRFRLRHHLLRASVSDFATIRTTRAPGLADRIIDRAMR